VTLSQIQAAIEEYGKRQAAAQAKNAVLDTDAAAELQRERHKAIQQNDIATMAQSLHLNTLRAEVEAVVKRFEAAQGGFSEALLALSNQETLQKIAEAMSVQQFVGGKNLTDVVDKVFAGTPLMGLMERVKQKATNGASLPPAAPQK
jgi:hypothetical protein